MNKKLSLPTLTCLRCGHSWYPNRPALPKVCPKCKSPYWNKPKWKGIPKLQLPKGNSNTIEKIEAPSFKATGNEVAIETIEIVNEGLDITNSDNKTS